MTGATAIPTYRSLIAAINFDLSGTTRIGKYLLNHSLLIPGLIATSMAVICGLFIAKLILCASNGIPPQNDRPDPVEPTTTTPVGGGHVLRFVAQRRDRGISKDSRLFITP